MCIIGKLLVNLFKEILFEFYHCFSTPSPHPSPRGASSYLSPTESLSQTSFSNDVHHQQNQYQPYQQAQAKQPERHVNFPPPQPPPRSCFSPQLTRDHYQANDEENAAIQKQVRNFCFRLCYHITNMATPQTLVLSS